MDAISIPVTRGRVTKRVLSCKNVTFENHGFWMALFSLPGPPPHCQSRPSPNLCLASREKLGPCRQRFGGPWSSPRTKDVFVTCLQTDVYFLITRGRHACRSELRMSQYVDVMSVTVVRMTVARQSLNRALRQTNTGAHENLTKSTPCEKNLSKKETHDRCRRHTKPTPPTCAHSC